MIQTLEKPKIQLRDYQKETIAKVYNLYRNGKKSVMLVAPTGSGKTLLSSHIMKDAVAKGLRVLFIVHRENLIPQTKNTLVNYGLNESDIGFVKAGYPHENGESVVIASVQTLQRRQDYPKDIGLVVFDECHTTAFFDSSRDLMRHYAQSPVMECSKVKFLHLTATPYRTKKKEYFGNFIQAVAYAPDISELIEMGYLSPARHYGYGGTNFDDIDKSSSGEFNQEEVIARTLDEDYNLDIVGKIYNYARDRKIILFCASVKQANLLSTLMLEKGFNSEIVTAKTKQQDRDQIYQRLRNGTTNCLIGVGCFTEGFDVPSVDCIALARPTNSVALLIQMCGRGLRIAEGKEDCLLLDFGGNFQRLGRIDHKREAEICPVEPEPPPTKECPECGAILLTFVQICPECGYEFEVGEIQEEPPTIPSQFGEILSKEEMEQIRYARTQRKMRYKKGHHPDGLFEKWEERYYKPLPQDWLYRAIFSQPSKDNEQRFLEYLQKFSTNPQWLKHHMSMEFEKPENRKKYTVPKPLTWWQVFNVGTYAPYSVVKDVYRVSIKDATEEDAQLLNWALQQAKKFCQ